MRNLTADCLPDKNALQDALCGRGKYTIKYIDKKRKPEKKVDTIKYLGDLKTSSKRDR